MIRNVGFVGVDTMGHGMAGNILEKDFALTVLGPRNRRPVGYLIYLTAAIAKLRLEDVIKECLPFMIALLVVLALRLFIPEITLARPRAFGL